MPLQLSGQNYEVYFKHITIQEGISDNYIHSIVQDKLGFIWIGTEAGLNRFDGYNSRIFKHDPDNSQSLSNDYINTLYLHPSGKIWIGTKGGLDVFDPLTETYTHYLHDPDETNTLVHNEVQAICGSARGGVWIGTHGGLQYVYVDKEGFPQHFQSFLPDKHDPFSIHTTYIYSLLEDSKGTLWIGSDEDGLGRMYPANEGGKARFFHYPYRGQDPNGISNRAVMTIYEDAEGRIWVGNWAGGLHLYKPEIDGFELFMPNEHDPTSINHEHVYTICEDQFNNLWVGTYGGGLSKVMIDEAPEESVSFRSFAFDYVGMDPIRDYRIRTLYLDRSGILWAGSLGGGVKTVNQRPQEFQQFHGDWKKSIHDKKYTVTALMVDSKNKVWVGVQNEGLECIEVNDSTQQFSLLAKYKHHPQRTNCLSNGHINVIFEDKEENIWIGTKNGLNFLKEGKGNEFRHYFHDPIDKFSLTDNEILSISEDVDGRIWIGTAKGLNLFDPAENKFSNYQNDNGFIFTFTEEDDITLFRQIQSGTYFAGGQWFLGEIDRSRQEGIFHWEAGKLESDFFRYKVNCSYETRAGDLWLGTQRGLNLYTKADGFTHYEGEEELSAYMVTSIQEDNLSNLWLGTPAGLLRFNPETATLKQYDMQGRADHNDLSAGTVAMASNGRIFLGSQDGLIYFKPAQLHTNNDVVPVVINELRVSANSVRVGTQEDSRQILKESIATTDEIRLLHTEQVINLEFVALSFFQQHEYQYAYMLEGVDDKWIYTDANNRSVTYGKLSPGTYTFKVKAANSDGLWSETPTNLRIVMLPPFWKTNWAYACYTILLIVLITASKSYTKKRIELENQLKIEKLEQEKIAEVNQIKLDFFTNISHELRTPLTLILGPLDRLRKQAHERNRETVELMYRNTEKLLRLINQLMDFRKQEAGGIKLLVYKQELSDFVQNILNSFKGLAEEKEISLYFLPPDQKVELWYDPAQLEKVIYNLLSNAFKFTEKRGKISVRISEFESFVEISVEDNGSGIEKEELPFIFERFYQSKSNANFNQIGTGIGLALSKHLVELHHGKIRVNSKVGEGSCFTVSILKGKDHFSPSEIGEGSVAPMIKPLAPIIPILSDTKDSRPKPPAKAPLVLIVEDNLELHDYVTQILSEKYHVKGARDGKQAWNMIQSLEPDIIISDIMMPGMDGWELCQTIKSDIRTSHIPVILLTAKRSQEAKIRGLRSGADGYISKPFHNEELLLSIQNIFEARRKFKASFSKDIDLEPAQVVIASPDQKLLEDAKGFVEANVSDADYDVNQLVRDLGMSRSLLYMKFGKLTTYSPNEFIKTIRLKRAAQLLEQGQLRVSDVCYQVGFKTPKHFSKSFKAFYGQSPTEFIQQKRQMGVSKQ